MIRASDALNQIPSGLRDPLLTEYQSIVQNYVEHRWSPSELSGGKFCEIVYTIIDGFGKGAFANAPTKPANFLTACRALENNAKVPRSFQILIPRLLPTLYEIRNNRGVGHVGGDVDPNHMDATLVVSMCNWVMAELVRVFHNLSTEDASELVNSLAERRIPLVWQSKNVRRVLNPSLGLREQILLLIASSATAVQTQDLLRWTDYGNRSYFFKLLRQMHSKRLLELSGDEQAVEILPPGSAEASKLMRD